MKNNTSETKGTPAILQDRTGTYNVKVTKTYGDYSTVLKEGESYLSFVLNKDLIFLDNLI